MDSHVEPDRKKKKSSKKEARKKLKLLLPKRVEGEGKLQSTLDGYSKNFVPDYVSTNASYSKRSHRTLSVGPPSLKGFSQPWSVFLIKRQEVKSQMKSNHHKRRQRLTPKNVRKTTHILETMLRENTLLGY